MFLLFTVSRYICPRRRQRGRERRKPSTLLAACCPRTIPIIATRVGAMTVLPLLAFVIPIARRQPHHAQQHEQLQHHHHRHGRSPLPPLQATLRVCTDEDCVQQGAYQALARLKREAKGEGLQVDSCACLGMCGLGPCVSIDWDGSRMESRGGIDASDDAAIRQIVEDAVKPPQSKTPATQERDPYAEQ